MKAEIIKSLTNNFEAHSHQDNGVEFWLARDLQKLLGYAQWRNFVQVIEKAKIACKNAGQEVNNHFADVSKMVNIGSGAQKPITDIMLTRYACYLIAQNGDSSKEPIAFAMNYFAIQTRKQEVLEQRIKDWERLQAREKLTLSEKELSGVVYQRGVDSRGFAFIRSAGDKALFGGHTTEQMKERLGVAKYRPLADFLPTITIKGKDFANEITIFNVKKDDVKGTQPIMQEHEKNNLGVRELLSKRGIRPEELPPEEDAKKLKRRAVSEDKKMLKDVKTLKSK